MLAKVTRPFSLAEGVGSGDETMGIEHFADSVVLISDVPIRTFPCDMLRNNYVT